MNFLLGTALLIILIPYNLFALKLIQKISNNATQIYLTIMTLGNMLLAVMWSMGMTHEITNLTQFLMGIGLATIMNTTWKIIYVIVYLKKK